MKVTLNWLKEYVDITVPAAELADRLTMAGLEVKNIETVGGDWENIVVGRITEVNPHPNADRLRLATVDLGVEQIIVVCGAPNLQVGDKIAFARVGAKLLDAHTGKIATLKPAKIRGISSSGMICSEKELGISDRHEGILVLPPEAPLGRPLSELLGDVIFTIEVTPNRPDCLSVIGIAREVAALTGQTLRMPPVSYEETEPPVDSLVSVEIVAPDLCPRYCASIINGVKVADSPPWMQQRLAACGQRPISNVVDVTNYVMLEYGQPLHSFNYAGIVGKQIIVRRAEEGEKMTTLDGTERTLSASMLVITDKQGPVAVAGVMGGADTEVTHGTTSILLEAASFKPDSIHYTSRALNLVSEASMRFERGIRADVALPALRRATQLIAQLGGGKAAKGVVDVYPGKREHAPIRVSARDVERILGISLEVERMESALAALGFESEHGGSGELIVKVPWWRSDINIPVDLVEEIARAIGYDRIPLTMLDEPLPHHNPDPMVRLKQETRNVLVGYGFQDIVTFSLVSQDMLLKLSPGRESPEPPPIRMANPMSVDQEYLRTTLRANLLSTVASNQRHEDGGVWLFEVGRVYLPRHGELPDEREMVCAVMNGPWWEKSWQGDEKLPDFFQAKGAVAGLFGKMGVVAHFEPYNDLTFHAAKQAEIYAGGSKIGVFGEVNPQVLDNFGISGATYMFEIDLAALLPATSGHKLVHPLPRFPATVRDLALVVPADVTNRQIVSIIEGFPLVESVRLFDVYTGEQVPPGKKSLAYRVTYQSPERTLSDTEVNDVQAKILEKLNRDLDAVLRA